MSDSLQTSGADQDLAPTDDSAAELHGGGTSPAPPTQPRPPSSPVRSPLDGLLGGGSSSGSKPPTQGGLGGSSTPAPKSPLTP